MREWYDLLITEGMMDNLRAPWINEGSLRVQWINEGIV